MRISALILGGLLAVGNVTAESIGEAIYYACGMCHGAQGEGSEAWDAPPLAGTPQWYLEEQLRAFRDGRRGNTRDTMPGRRMALFAQALPAGAALEEVAAYASALQRSPTSATPSTAQVPPGFAGCAGCHGSRGEGIEALGAPPIAGQPGWYLARQLLAFKNGHRGLQPGDKAGLSMRAAMVSLPEDPLELAQLVAFIGELRHPSLAPAQPGD